MLAREEQTRSLRHDIKHHLSLIEQLLDRQELEPAKKYLSELTGWTDKLNVKSDTGNDVLNIVINDVWRQSEDVELQWEGALPNNRLSDIEICILFSNILKNALESTLKCETDRIVKVQLRQANSALVLKCENPVSELVSYKNGRPVSTKESGIHGIGLINVEEIVNKYSGTITYSSDEKFTVDIVLENVFS